MKIPKTILNFILHEMKHVRMRYLTNIVDYLVNGQVEDTMEVVQVNLNM